MHGKSEQKKIITNINANYAWNIVDVDIIVHCWKIEFNKAAFNERTEFQKRGRYLKNERDFTVIEVKFIKRRRKKKE